MDTLPIYPFAHVADQPIRDITWQEKYRDRAPDGTPLDATIAATKARVARAIYRDDPDHRFEAMEMLTSDYFLAGGRTTVAAGTTKRATLINCFCNIDLPDSLEGILEGQVISASTHQMGGGIGTPFGTLRPADALVKRTCSKASGVVPFMVAYDAWGTTIESLGSRRAASMATLPIWHPDIHRFIASKHTRDALKNFNISVLVDDQFMARMANGEDWDLGFWVPRADGQHVEVQNGHWSDLNRDEPWYVYERLPARDLWEELLRSTYEYAEPGIIFIDRVNRMNPMSYCEEITTTNPCGEQPLPPLANCNLAHLNLAFMVKGRPFTNEAVVNWPLVEEVARRGVRFLDNVIDVTTYPTEGMREEGLCKRRIGLGYTGIANTLQQMQLHFDSEEARTVVTEVTSAMTYAAYRASIALAKERGPFPAFNRDEHLKGEFVQRLPEDIRQGIADHGLRNAVLMSLAPVGTGSLFVGNVSSGPEPSYGWEFDRKFRMAGSTEPTTVRVEDYGYRLWKHLHDDAPLPDYFVKATELTVDAHVKMAAVQQRWIDASISKTVNVPAGATFDEFAHVYQLAWDLNMKGCTTYRPTDFRGSVLSEPMPEVEAMAETLAPRPEELPGRTYKVRWPLTQDALYVTVNDACRADGKTVPFEVFIQSSKGQSAEWLAAMSRMVSAVWRREFSVCGDPGFVVGELKRTFAAAGGAWVDGVMVPSVPALIGGVIERHLVSLGLKEAAPDGKIVNGANCPECGEQRLWYQSGCRSCMSCGWSAC